MHGGHGGTSWFAPRDFSLQNRRTVFGQLQQEWGGSDPRPSQSFVRSRQNPASGRSLDEIMGEGRPNH
jgi:hypothetical protein